jgi:hypothetical protein
MTLDWNVPLLYLFFLTGGIFFTDGIYPVINLPHGSITQPLLLHYLPLDFSILMG